MNAVAEKPAPKLDAGDLAAFSSAALTPPPAQPAAKPRRIGRTLIRVGVVLVVLAGVAVTASWWFIEGRFIESTDNAYIQGDIAVLGARVEGNVGAIHVADNQAVREGDPLVSLNDRDGQARVAQAQGGVAEADAAVTTAQRQLEQQRAAIAVADAAIASAEADQVRATADAGRAASLSASGWASRQSNDQAVADRRKADAALLSARAQKLSAEQLLSVMQAQIVQAQAKQQTTRAALRLAQNDLADMVIRAPFDGVVGNRAAQLGQHVQPGTQLIAVAPPPGRLYVTANFKETQLRRMRPGQPVLLTPDIDSGGAVHGRVASVAPATGALFSLLPPENATGNFTKVVQRVPVKIVIDPAEAARAGWLRAGLSVTAEVDTRSPEAPRRGLFGTAGAALASLVP